MSYLDDYLSRSAVCCPDRVAVEESDGSSLTYSELDRLAERVKNHLLDLGVRQGDRVGLCLAKSIDTVAAIFGILKAQAVYVPVDAGAPAARNAFIFHDCRTRVVFVEDRNQASLRDALCEIDSAPSLVILDRIGGGVALSRVLDEADSPIVEITPVDASIDDLAYILYTSGSTGKPKGVMLSHRNARSFVDWCSLAFEPGQEERFSSHAPFHFDLSILDLYVPIKHGATVVLIGEELGKDPMRLADLICEKRLTSWYSAPSILSLLTQYGKLEERDFSCLERILFAGEVFPVKHLRRLVESIPGPTYFNLYGPTETNVCTYFQIPETIDDARSEPFPIGPVCQHLKAKVVVRDGQDAEPGAEGELMIAGPSVMQGYWNLPERTRAAFVEKGDRIWYHTGDVVIEEDGGVFTFVGRRDRMVKRRGYRIELGEIESALYNHAELSEVAVSALSLEDGLRITAHYSTADGHKVSMISLKRFCSENLPLYMVPDRFVFHEVLPKTSTDKIDYQILKGMA